MRNLHIASVLLVLSSLANHTSAQDDGWAPPPPVEEETPWYARGEGAPEPDAAYSEPSGDVARSEAEAPEPSARAPEQSVDQREAPDERAPSDEEDEDEDWPLDVRPYATIIGGIHYQDVVNRDGDDGRQDRVTTVAMTRFGLHARIHRHVSLISELDLNAGPHGTSVWEGQAALQVRDQLLRIDWGPLRVDAGRITDPASQDYFSGYVANMLLTDPLSRFSMLVSGFNRGNGVRLRVEPIEGLRVAATFNAGNPTSTTGTVQIGGTFPPFSRFYEVPSSHVGRDARGFPSDSFHVMLFSPSLRYEHDLFRVQLAVQMFSADTNTNSSEDANIRGYNVRGGAQLRLWDDRIRPFLNVSRVVNDVVDPSNTDRLLNEDYEARTISGGFDFVVHPDSGSGFGGQYARIREQQGSGTVIVRHYWNVGGTWWFFPNVGVDVRAGIYARCDNDDCRADGERSYWLTLRGNLGSRPR